MGDDAVGRLLQALQRSQLRVRTLKFRGNGIGSAGGPGLGIVPGCHREGMDGARVPQGVCWKFLQILNDKIVTVTYYD